MRKNSFEGYIWADICCELEDVLGIPATQIEEELTSEFDGTNMQYVVCYPNDIIKGMDDDTAEAFAKLCKEKGIEMGTDLIFVMV